MPSESAPTLRESIEWARVIADELRMAALRAADDEQRDTDALDAVCDAAEALEGLERLLRLGRVEWTAGGLCFSKRVPGGYRAFDHFAARWDDPSTLPAAIAEALAALEEIRDAE